MPVPTAFTAQNVPGVEGRDRHAVRIGHLHTRGMARPGDVEDGRAREGVRGRRAEEKEEARRNERRAVAELHLVASACAGSVAVVLGVYCLWV